MSNVSLDSSFEEIEGEISDWGYMLALSDFEKSLQIDEPTLIQQPVVVGRGRGIISEAHSSLRMASEINDLKVRPVPMGREETSNEILNNPPENEITPLLRKLGIFGYDECISSHNTRRNPEIERDIHMDRNIPVLLNGDLFNVSNCCQSDTSDNGSVAKLDDDDPTLPLEQRFPTIKEFRGFSGNQQESSPSQTESSSYDLIQFSTTLDSGESSTSSSSMDNEKQVGSLNDGYSELLLNAKAKVYTPRELYRMKRDSQVVKD